MKIKQLKTSSLIPYEFNNRVHDQQQIDRIANSIASFGFNQPIVIDENNIILVGHGRLAAAMKLELEEVPCLQVLGLTETEKKAYRVLDNKLQNDSDWDWNNLNLELGNLEDNGFDLAAWGLDELLAMAPADEPEVSEDAGPGALPDEPFIKRGDIIELGPHRVMCGSFDECPFVDDVAAIITDPPYGIDEQTDRAYAARSRIAKGGRFDKIIGDENNETAIKAVERFSEVPTQVWWGANHYHSALVESPTWLVWDKRVDEKESDFNSDCELAWIKHTSKSVRIFRHKWKGLIKDSEHGIARVHPTQKPIELMGHCIKAYCPEGVILDPFLGSGTTLIAADQLGRTCYGMEISPKYCQVILERYQRYCADKGKECVIKINGEEFKGAIPADV